MVKVLQAAYRITGKVRGENNEAAEGYTITAFDKDPGIYLHPDDRLGKARTDDQGRFEISFSSGVFKDWFEGDPEVYLLVRDGDGRVVLTTSSKENKTRAVDFEVKLGIAKANAAEPDIYAGGLDRMIGAFRQAGDFADLANGDVSVVLELLLRTLGSWTLYRDEYLASAGYDGIQVPKVPRREEHYHATRWDEAILP